MSFKMVREFDGYKNAFLVSSVTRTETGDVLRRSKWFTLTGILNDLEGLYIARTEYLNVDKDVTELKIVSDDLIYDSCVDIDTKKVEYLVKQWLIELYIKFVDAEGIVHEVELHKEDDGTFKHKLKNLDKKAENYDTVTFYITHILDKPSGGIFTSYTQNRLKLTNFKKLISALKKLEQSSILPEVELNKDGKPRNMTQKKKKEIENSLIKFNESVSMFKKVALDIGIDIPNGFGEVTVGALELTLPSLQIEFATYVDKEGFECVCDV